MILPIQNSNLDLQIQPRASIQKRSYSEILAEEIDSIDSSDSSFEEQWRDRFGGFYHVMETDSLSKWKMRNDFPFERFFTDQVDPSILKW